jgi:outer membrane assembly lipoprotein YfiO
VDESQYWIAWSTYQKGLYEEAIREFTEVTENPSSSHHASQALLKIGDCYYNQESYSEATASYLEVIRLFPGSEEAPKAEYGILLSLEQQGQYEDFVAKARTFLSAYPAHPLGADILLRLAQYYVDLGLEGNAIATYRELLRNHSRSDMADDARFKLGEIYRRRQDFKSAIVQFGNVVKQYPKSDYLVDAYFGIAEGYFGLEDYRRALEVYGRVARNFPESHLAGQAYLRAARCFEELDRNDLAERVLTELMESHPDDAIRFEGALRLGLILFEDVRYAEAVRAFGEAAKSDDPAVANVAQGKIDEIHQRVGSDGTASDL